MRDWLAQRARATPVAVAAAGAGEAPDRGRDSVRPSPASRTFADLDERAEELAGRLAARDVGPGDHLGVVVEPGPVAVDLVHAAMRVGAVFVPLSPGLTPRELADRLARADVSVLLCGAETEADAAAALGRLETDEGADGSHESVPAEATRSPSLVSIDAPTAAGAAALARTDPVPFDAPAWTDDSTALVLFTSGTTGRPKAVRLTVGNLAASATASAFRLGLRPDDRWYVPLPTHHMGGLAPIYRSALYGTTVVVESGGFAPETTLAAMDDRDATCVSLVPTMLSRLLDAGRLPASLRVVLLGGAPAPDDLLRRCASRDVPVCPTYGLTETASQVATALPEQATEHVGTVGHPLLYADVTVVDAAGAECEPGETGEVVVSGPTVTPGYYGDPAATREAFSADGLHTGDTGYLDESGRLWIEGRLDERIVTGGENVDPGEVAAALREHPGVADAAVVGRPDPEWGERVAALVVPADGTDEASGAARPSPDDLRAFCRDRLAGFKLPRTVALADELPRTASGTVDREAVGERIAEATADR